MELRNLQDVFRHELKDMHNAEKQILKALPDMVKAVENQELKTALEEHRKITETQVDRLEQILGDLDESIRSTKKCKGMEGILEEGKDLLKENKSKDGNGALDSAVIGAAQKVEHYEIAAYGTLVAFAKTLGKNDAAELLEESLGEEKEADEKLTEIAASINEESAENGDETMEEGSRTRQSQGGMRTRGATGTDEEDTEGSETENEDEEETEERPTPRRRR